MKSMRKAGNVVACLGRNVLEGRVPFALIRKATISEISWCLISLELPVALFSTVFLKTSPYRFSHFVAASPPPFPSKSALSASSSE